MKYLLLLIILMSANILAEESDTSEINTDDAQQSSWKGNVEFGYVSSSGNTDTTNMNGKFHIEAAYNNWTQLFDAATFSSSNNEDTTAERFKLAYQGDRKFSDKSYFFVSTEYEKDRFSGFQYRASATSGYGRILYNENNMSLDGEVGIGARKSETDIDLLTGISTSEIEGIIKLAMKYQWQIEKNKSLESKLTVDPGMDTTISNFEIAFITMIVGDLSMKASYAARYVSDVPVEKNNLDTVTKLNLLYAF